MAKKISIKRVSKKELMSRIIQFRPEGLTDDELYIITKRLSLRSLCFVAQAFHFQFMLFCLINRYRVVRKLFNKIFFQEFVKKL